MRTIKLTTGTLNLCSGTIPSLPTWTHFTNDRNFHFSLVNNFTMLENRRHVEKCIHYNGMTQHTLHTHFLPTLLHLKINHFGNSGRMNRSPPERKRTPRLAHCHARAQVVDVECDWGLPTFVKKKSNNDEATATLQHIPVWHLNATSTLPHLIHTSSRP